MLDHFQMGPNLVRGFAPAGIGPRDMTLRTPDDALGGTHVLGRECRSCSGRCSSCRRISASSSLLFADAGSLWNYGGPTTSRLPASASGATGATPTLSVNDMT